MNSKKRSVSALWSYTRGYRGKLFLAFVIMLLELVLSFITPLVTSVTIDSVLDSNPLNTPWYFTPIITLCGGIQYIRQHIWVMALLIVIMAALSGLLSILRPSLTSSAAFQIARDLRDRFYGHVQRLPFSYHAKTQTGDLIQRATSDIDTTQRLLSNVVLELFRTFFLLVVGFFVMTSLNLSLTVISFSMIPLFILDSMWFMKKIDAIVEQFEDQESRVYTVIQENLTGARVVRAFGREKFEVDKLHLENENLRGQFIHFYNYLCGLWLSLDILSGLQIAIVTILGVVYTVQGKITLGQYTAFVSYMTIFLMPIQNLGRVLGQVSRSLVAIHRLETVMQEPEEDYVELGLTPPLSGDIVFENISFAYDNTPVLNHLNMTIHSGETVAILGGTGSGKSTLIQLLQRLYDPAEGTITIGGVDIASMNKQHLRSSIGLVMQEPYLYSKTIGQNIGIKYPQLSQTEIEDAAKIACVHQDILEFDQGYDTVIGERGVTLSGGQKQRVSIARAILGHSDILIFDDALSAVDTKTDQFIRQALKLRQKDTTTIIISHRISTLMEADRIFVLSRGQVAECGTHQELLSLENGIYRRVYEIQTGQTA